MKKIIMIFSLAFTTLLANATTLTVSNSTLLPSSPGQYATLQAAVTAAFAGDTILIHGSANAYAGATISKKITILGPGYNPQKQNPLVANFGTTTITFGNGSSNSYVAGLYQVSFGVSASVAISNIILERNYIQYVTLNSFCSGFIIQQNYLYGSVNLGATSSNIQVRNNIVSTDLSYSTSSTLQIKNNLFLCNSALALGYYSPISNADIRNNIFYEKSPMNSINNNVTLSAFNNNITYNCTYGTIPSGSNVGSGNIINQDPIFLGAPDCGGSLIPVETYNWRLHPTSPGKNAGTDGTDIGPTGGVSPIYIYATGPLTGEPAIPQVYFENIPVSSVPVGGSFNVDVKARKKN